MSTRAVIPRSSTFATPSAARERERERDTHEDDHHHADRSRSRSRRDHSRSSGGSGGAGGSGGGGGGGSGDRGRSADRDRSSTDRDRSGTDRGWSSHRAGASAGSGAAALAGAAARARSAEREAAAMLPSGSFNSRRSVPPPSYPRPPQPGSSSMGPSPSSSSAPATASAAAAAAAPYNSAAGPSLYPTRSGGPKSNQLYTRAVVLVDEATEPGIGDIEGEHKRVEIVNLVHSGGDPRYGAVSGNSPGAAVAFAIRKRLKSEDHVAVLNTLTLLDEVMRTCPYFYRYIANDKFFRRLWRFVDPQYKTDLRGRIPFVGKSAAKTAGAMRSTSINVELAERVLILVRAWAEELSIMFSGSHDPDAGFFIERYSSKRLRIKFPDVPTSGTPWVCHVGTQPGPSRFATAVGQHVSSTTAPLPQSLSIREVENTVNLFSNMLEKATDLDEVRSDVCTDLAQRCRVITHNLDTITGRMDKEEDIARAIRVSELLQKTLAAYDDIIATGELKNSPPIVDGLTETESEDEGYDVESAASSSRALRTPSDEKHYDRGTLATDIHRGTREHSSDRGIHDPRGGREDRDLAHGNRSAREEYYARGDRDEDDVDLDEQSLREKAKSKREVEEKRLVKKESKKVDSNSSKASERSDKSSSKGKSKKDIVDNATSASKAKNLSSSKASKELSSEANRLVDLAEPEEENLVEGGNVSKKEGAFNMLAERYSSVNPSSIAPNSSIDPSQIHPTSAESAAAQTLTMGMHNLGMSVPPLQQGSQVPGPQAQFPYDAPHNPVFLMPNPMAMSMYGSYNPGVPPLQPYQSMYSAYNTVNPAMYYSNMNTMAYNSTPTSASGVPMAPGSFMAGPASNTGPTTPVTQQGSTPDIAPPLVNLSSSVSTVSPATMASSSQATFPTSGVAPVPPPPVSSASYATVSNAPAPPPSEPPPMNTESSERSAKPGSNDREYASNSIIPGAPSSLSTRHDSHQQVESLPEEQKVQRSEASVSAQMHSQAQSIANQHAHRLPQTQQLQQANQGLDRSIDLENEQLGVQKVQQALHSQFSQAVPAQQPHQVQPQSQMPSSAFLAHGPGGLVGINPGLYGSFSGPPLVPNPLMYGSIGGQQPVVGPGMPPAIANVPPMPVMGNPYASNNGPRLQSAAGMDQAALYQNAMAQAAAQYHALASAYQSTQGQLPVQPSAGSSGSAPSSSDQRGPS